MKHKTLLLGSIATVGLLGLGYVMGDREARDNIAKALQFLDDEAYLKWFDPKTGVQVSVDEAVKIAKENLL